MKNWERLKLDKKQKAWEIFKIRSLIIKWIRDFFWSQGFWEVETPLMVPWVIPEPNIVHFKTLAKNFFKEQKKMYLTSSPEASHKKLLCAGAGDIFEITKSFRNQEQGCENHSFEFTILEFYRKGADYQKIMEDCQNLFAYLIKNLKLLKGKKGWEVKIPKKGNTLIYQNKKINFNLPWQKITVKEAWEKYTGINFDEITGSLKNKYPIEKIKKIALAKKYQIQENNSWEEIFNQIFLNEVEPKLLQNGHPLFLYDYPLPLGALAKVKSDNPFWVERFELYIGGLEIGNCYSELTNFEEQEKRFAELKKEFSLKKREWEKVDKDYLKALKLGLPECSGIAIGVDRLVMLFTDSKYLDDVRLFPSGEK